MSFLPASLRTMAAGATFGLWRGVLYAMIGATPGIVTSCLTARHLAVVALTGMLPGTALYVYAGSVARKVAAAAGGATAPRGARYYTVLALGLLATLTVTIVIARVARRALAVQ